MQNINEYIETTRAGLVAATEGLTEDQWKFQPTPECWSIAQILEHVVTTQDMVLGPVCQRLASAPPVPADHDREQIEALIVSRFKDRSRKFKGPEVLMPTGRMAPAEALTRLSANCVRQGEYLASTPGLREHAVESAPLKAVSEGKFQFMDGYQLMLTLAAHVARHTGQILEVKADPQFPAHAGRTTAA